MQSERQRWGKRTEEWLCDAAMRGDVELLKQIIEIDEYIIDRVLVGSFKGKNPLHVAILTGHTEFVLKLLETKEGLANGFDLELGTALHIASSEGNIEIVKRLVELRPEMGLARDRDGNNPLHIPAIKGKVEVLKELVQMSPRRAQVKTDRGSTILHLCVKYHHFDCLKELLGTIPDLKFVNAADADGNTILHLAVFEKKMEMIEHVLSSNNKIDVNAINKSGRTALDIHSHFQAGNSTEEIHRILVTNGAKTSEEVREPLEASWQIKRRNTFMIVASLIATVTFQVGVTPPGGVWPDYTRRYPPGKSILCSTNPVIYYNVLIPNTVGFLGSLTTIVLLIFALPEPKRSHRWARRVITWSTILAIDYAYVFSILGLTPPGSLPLGIMSLAIAVTCFLWMLVMAVLVYRIVSIGVAILVISFLWMLAMALFVYAFALRSLVSF
ncbi:hypothetical protein Vadar_001488 [Vaccinium darrowii]|uniref:Uncharacterized protein n=1 Tax=Vaccinium darrowii TaxID=229202 RepID=A0ACB7Z8F8_9ERIC|nr:hypothetical protein Vadar_001488 [Vaccinium darrowii]